MNPAASASPVLGFLMWKWHEEDDDGFNLVIINERRQRLERQMVLAASQELVPVHCEAGINYYDDSELEVLWQRLASAL